MSAVFLPLRSNAAWFAHADAHARLAGRIKHLLLFNETLVVQDGRYKASFLANGASDWLIPGSMVPDRSRITYHRPGSELHVRIAPSGTSDYSSLMGGALEASYDVDFWPVMAEAGITDVEYIEWVEAELTQSGKQKASSAAFRARQNPSLTEGLPVNRFLRDKIVDAIHQDSILAGELGLPLSVDHHASTIVERANGTARGPLESRLKPAMMNAWVTIGLPDPSEESWDSVLRARESAAGADLRRVTAKLEGLAIDTLAGAATEQDLEAEAGRLFVQEIVEELFARRVTAKGTVLNLGLNWIDLAPGVGSAIGSVRDIADLIKEKRSWVSLLAGLPSVPIIQVRE
jgi:hypothetical protein